MPYDKSYDNYGGYVLYEPKSPNERYYFDKSPNQMDMAQSNLQTSRQQLETFGRVPFVYYAGNTNFEIIQLDGVFVEGLCQDGSINQISARQQVVNFKRLLAKRIPLILKNSQGEGYVVDVAIDREETPKSHVSGESLDYVNLTIVCTEIGRFYNEVTIMHTEGGKGETKIYQDDELFETDVQTTEEKHLIGSGSGANISYKVETRYGTPIELKATPLTDVHFMGWYKNDGKIPNEYFSLSDKSTIEARFRKIYTITIEHIGNGDGETQVSQQRQVVEESNGRSSYQARVIDGVIVGLSETHDDEKGTFDGWKDADGYSIDIRKLLVEDGDVIYAEFNVHQVSVDIVHDGANIDSVAKQLDIVKGNGSGDGYYYTVKADIDKDLVISHNVDSFGYELVGITDQNGNLYDDTIPLQRLREGLELTITYKQHLVSLTVNHLGGGNGSSYIRQNGILLGQGMDSGAKYSITPEMDEPFDIETIVDINNEVIEIQDGKGNIIPSDILEPSDYYQGMVINIIFGTKGVPPDDNDEIVGSDNGIDIRLFNLGSNSGEVCVSYSMGGLYPDKMELWYNDVMIATTSDIEGNTTRSYVDEDGDKQTEDGFVTNSGSLCFDYEPIDFNYNLKVIVKPMIAENTSWSYRVVPPTQE